MQKGIGSRFYETLRLVYTPGYLILNIVIALIFYYVFEFAIRSQDYGILLFNVPQAAIYLLVATASILFTIALFSIRNTMRNKARYSASTLGVATTILGGVIGGCGCSAPLVFSLTAVGLSSSEVIGLNNFFSGNALVIFSAMIILNLVVMAYYLNKLSQPACRLPKQQRRKPLRK